MRKWWWLACIAVAVMPQMTLLAQEGEKKEDPKSALQKAEAEKKAADENQTPAALLRARQAAAMKEYNEVRALVGKKDFDAAEKLIEETIADKPNWPYAATCYQMLAMAHSQAGNKEKAGENAMKYVELQTKQGKRNPALLANLGRMMRNIAPLLKEGGQADKVAADLEKAMEEAITEGADRVSVIASKIRVLSALGKQDAADQATAMLDEETKKAVESEPKVVKNILARLDAIEVAIENFDASNAEKAAEFAKEKAAFIAKALAEFPKEFAILERHVRDEMNAIAAMGSEKAKEAEERLQKITQILNDADVGENESAKTRITSMRQTLANLARRIAAARKHFELIGQPATPMDGEFAAWVNGPTMTDADLKGKVVLIDFWAVWCGPCIATFPHLREWREKYGDKGFEIVGVTRYYKYDWDDEAKAIKRSDELEPAQEEAAMVKFAEHHKLKHVFAVQKADSKLAEFYGVTGIPQAVLIDKEGKVKLIRVGSGEANAHALEAAIRECLGLEAE